MARHAMRVLDFQDPSKIRPIPTPILSYLTAVNYSKPKLPSEGEKLIEPYMHLDDSIIRSSYNKLYDKLVTLNNQFHLKKSWNLLRKYSSLYGKLLLMSQLQTVVRKKFSILGLESHLSNVHPVPRKAPMIEDYWGVRLKRGHLIEIDDLLPDGSFRRQFVYPELYIGMRFYYSFKNLCDFVTDQLPKPKKVISVAPLGTPETHPGNIANPFELHPGNPYNKMVYPRDTENIKLGLPQGSPLSPALSSLYLQIFLNDLKKRYPSVHFVVYADDIIFYGDDDLEFAKFRKELRNFMREYHLILAEHKSQHSKSENIWLAKRLKFLGLVYLPETNTLMSETRSGRSLP